MVFNKQNKISFVCPTRTGSTTLHSYLHDQGWFRLKEKHHSLDALIEIYPSLTQYKVYGFFRNPLVRFESCITYAKQDKFFSSVFQYRLTEADVNISIEKITYEEIIGCFDKVFNFGGFLFKPQTFWLNDPRVTSLDFHNISTELEKVIGVLPKPIPVLNKSTDFGRSVVTQKVKDFVREYYAADYQFAKDVLGKEY
jgi:hypothetical protein